MPSIDTPALLHRMCSGPNRLSISRAVSARTAGSDTSETKVSISTAEVVQAGTRLGQRVGADVDHRHIGAGLRQRRGDAEADAGRRAGHVCGFAFEVFHDGHSSCRTDGWYIIAHKRSGGIAMKHG